MTGSRILVIDRDPALTALLRRSVDRQEVDHVDHVHTPAEALHRPHSDLVVLAPCELDDGLHVCRLLRDAWNPGIIVVTGAALPQRVRSLRAGADDVVAKPFALAELLARIEAVLRRCRRRGRQLRVGPLTVDVDSRRAAAAGRPLRLTPKEFDILVLLADQPGATVSRQRLAAGVWHTPKLGSSRTLEVHMSALRAKLKGVARVENVRGFGYRLRPCEAGREPALTFSPPRAGAGGGGGLGPVELLPVHPGVAGIA